MSEKNKSEVKYGFTPEQISAAKEKHGNKVRVIELPRDDEGSETLHVLAIVPGRKIIGQFQRYSDNDPNKANEILVKNCLLSHVDEVLADDGLFWAAVSGLSELIPIRKATIKNV